MKKLFIASVKGDSMQTIKSITCIFLFLLTSTAFAKDKEFLTFSTCQSLQNIAKDQCLEKLSLAPVKKDGKWGFIDIKGETVISFQYAGALQFTDGLAPVQIDTNNYASWGFINKQGVLVIPVQYADIRSFNEGWAAVSNKEGYWGFIDKTGKLILPFQYMNANMVSEGLAAVRQKDSVKWTFINKKGKIAVPGKYDFGGLFKEGLVSIQNLNGQFAFLDKKGKLKTEFKYGWLNEFYQGYALARERKSGNWGVLNKKFQWVISPIYSYLSNFSEGLFGARIAKDEKENIYRWGFINLKGETVLPFEYEDNAAIGFKPSYFKGLAPAIKDEKLGYIDRNGKVLIPFQYEAGGNFSE
jgi:hypothetical protein